MKKLITIIIVILFLTGCSTPDEMTVGVSGAETNYGALGKAPMVGGFVSFTWKLKDKK